MFIDKAMIPRVALQRSAMFPAMNVRLGYVPLLRSGAHISSLRSINITSLLRDYGARQKTLL